MTFQTKYNIYLNIYAGTIESFRFEGVFRSLIQNVIFALCIPHTHTYTCTNTFINAGVHIQLLYFCIKLDRFIVITLFSVFQRKLFDIVRFSLLVILKIENHHSSNPISHLEYDENHQILS